MLLESVTDKSSSIIKIINLTGTKHEWLKKHMRYLKISNSKGTHVVIAKNPHSYPVKAVKGTELNQRKIKNIILPPYINKPHPCPFKGFSYTFSFI